MNVEECVNLVFRRLAWEVYINTADIYEDAWRHYLWVSSVYEKE